MCMDVQDVHEHEHEEIKIRTHVNKICSLRLLVWDILVFLNFRFAIFLRIWFLFHSNLHFLICYKSVQIWSLSDVSCHIALECLFDKHMAHLHYSFEFGHGMLSLTYLTTRWHHLRELQSWPPDGTTRISHKVVHQMAPLALVPNLTTRWRQLH